MAGRMIRRGDLVVVATPGAYGKPRPALVVQSDLFQALPSVTICPLSTTLRDDAHLLRVDIEPTKENGIRQASQILVDKITIVPVGKIGGVIGVAGEETVLRVNRALAIFLAIV